MHFIDLKAQQEKLRSPIDKRIKKVLDHGKYIMGPEVFELEEKLANYVGSKFCISCSSGTDALLIPLMAKNIGPGDAVFTTAFTYIATAEVISLLGATPIFVDIYPQTYNINPEKLNRAYEFSLSQGLSPKVIISVDLFGLPARYRQIKDFSKEKNLFLIEDGAQGFGGEIRGKKACSFGDISSTSFFPAKPLGGYGDGGAIFTDDDNLADIMTSIRIHGKGSNKYDNIRIGINGRLDTLQAAILLEKLSIIDDEVNKRNEIAKYYTENLKNTFITPHIPEGYKSSWAQFSILAPSKKFRQKVMDYLKKYEIPTMIYYPIPLHFQGVFEKLKQDDGSLNISEEISGKIFSLPMHPYLNKSEQDYIIELLNNFNA